MNFDMSMRSFQSEQHFLKRTARSQMPTLRHGACHTSRTLVVTNDGLGGSKHQGILVQTSLAQGALPRSLCQQNRVTMKSWVYQRLRRLRGQNSLVILGRKPILGMGQATGSPFKSGALGRQVVITSKSK